MPVERRRQTAEAPEPGRHRERVPRQRAGLVDRAGRRHQLHQIGAAAVGADRQAAADDLAEAGQIRPDAVDRLRAACAPRGSPKSPRRRSAAPRCAVHSSRSAAQEAVGGRHDAHVAGDRLDDERGNLVAIGVEQPLHRFEVVVGRRPACRRPRRASRPGWSARPASARPIRPGPGTRSAWP